MKARRVSVYGMSAIFSKVTRIGRPMTVTCCVLPF